MSDMQEKYEIYIGLKDKESYEEYFTIDEFKEIIMRYCSNNNIAFSLIPLKGGYYHNKGYTTENSIKIELIGADHETVKKMALELKEKINTDTVMITSELIEAEYK